MNCWSSHLVPPHKGARQNRQEVDPFPKSQSRPAALERDVDGSVPEDDFGSDPLGARDRLPKLDTGEDVELPADPVRGAREGLLENDLGRPLDPRRD